MRPFKSATSPCFDISLFSHFYSNNTIEYATYIFLYLYSFLLTIAKIFGSIYYNGLKVKHNVLQRVPNILTFFPSPPGTVQEGIVLFRFS